MSSIFLITAILVKMIEISLELNIKVHHQEFINNPISLSRKNTINQGYLLPMIDICLGTPPQCFKTVIDSFGYYSWVNNVENKTLHSFNSTLSSTYGKLSQSYLSIDYEYFDMMGVPSTDKFSFSSMTSNQSENFTFISVFSLDKKNLSFDGYLSLAQDYSDRTINKKRPYQLSLLEILKKEQVINHKVFSIRYISDKEGILRIGYLPSFVIIDDIYKIYKNELSQKEVKYLYLESSWNVKIHEFSFGNLTSSIKHNYIATIATGQLKIICPYSFRDFNEYFIAIASKYSTNCTIEHKNHYKYLFCEPFNVMDLPKTEISLTNYTLIVKPEDLFIWTSNGKYECVIQVKMDLNYWIIGDPALRNEYMVFDMENEYLGFITQKIPQEFVENEKGLLCNHEGIGMVNPYVINTTQAKLSTKRSRYYIWVSCMLLIAIAFLLLIQKGLRKQKISNENEDKECVLLTTHNNVIIDLSKHLNN